MNVNRAIINELSKTIEYGLKRDEFNTGTVYIYNLSHVEFNNLTGCNLAWYTRVYDNILEHVEDIHGVIIGRVRFEGGNNESN